MSITGLKEMTDELAADSCLALWSYDLFTDSKSAGESTGCFASSLDS